MTDQKVAEKMVNASNRIMSQDTLRRLNATSSDHIGSKVDQGTTIIMATVEDDQSSPTKNNVYQADHHAALGMAEVDKQRSLIT